MNETSDGGGERVEEETKEELEKHVNYRFVVIWQSGEHKHSKGFNSFLSASDWADKTNGEFYSHE